MDVFWDSSWSLEWRLSGPSLHTFFRFESRSTSFGLASSIYMSTPSTHPHICSVFRGCPAFAGHTLASHRLASPKLCRPQRTPYHSNHLPSLLFPTNELYDTTPHICPLTFIVHHHHHPTVVRPTLHVHTSIHPYDFRLPSLSTISSVSGPRVDTILHAPDQDFLTPPASRNLIVDPWCLLLLHIMTFLPFFCGCPSIF